MYSDKFVFLTIVHKIKIKGATRSQSRSTELTFSFSLVHSVELYLNLDINILEKPLESCQMRIQNWKLGTKLKIFIFKATNMN